MYFDIILIFRKRKIMANNKQVTAEYFDFKDAVSDQKGIKPACRLCGKIVTTSWQGKEDSREKKIWQAHNLQRHLIEWHKTEWTTQIEPRMKFKLTPNKRSTAPGNTTEKLHKLQRVVTESLNFSCFWCGVQMAQQNLYKHRRLVHSLLIPYNKNFHTLLIPLQIHIICILFTEQKDMEETAVAKTLEDYTKQVT
jgi:hypothetical protein